MGLKRNGDLKSAELMLRRALAIVHAAGSDAERGSGILLGNLASILLMMNRIGEALPLLHRALALKEVTVGLHSPSVGHTLFQFANVYASQGEFMTARPLAQRSCSIYDAPFGAENPDAVRTRGLLEQIEHDMRRTGQLPSS